MLREDLIEGIEQTYPAADPAGAEPTALLLCARGPLALEPETETRARDERIAGDVLARGLILAIVPSFVQLLGLLPWPFLVGGVFILLIRWGIDFARTFLNDWPLRPGRTLGLVAASYAIFFLTTRWDTPEAGHCAVLLPALLGLNWFATALAHEFVGWPTSRLMLEEPESARLRVAHARLRVPDLRIVTAAVASFAVHLMGSPLAALATLIVLLAVSTLGDGSRAAAKEAIVRFFSYNAHECNSPFVFQFEEPFRRPAARRSICSALMTGLGCGLAAAANHPPALTLRLVVDAFVAPSPGSDAAWATIGSELLGWALRTAFIGVLVYPVLILSIAASAAGALVPTYQLLEEDE